MMDFYFIYDFFEINLHEKRRRMDGYTRKSLKTCNQELTDLIDLLLIIVIVEGTKARMEHSQKQLPPKELTRTHRNQNKVLQSSPVPCPPHCTRLEDCIRFQLFVMVSLAKT